ncbi:MAG TPA: hypothetical protein VIF32_11660 [Gemmatimonadaceae bacterium]
MRVAELARRNLASERGESPSDAAIFAWAATDPRVAERANRAEAERMRLFRTLTRKPGVADLFYYAYHGFLLRRRRVPQAAGDFDSIARLALRIIAREWVLASTTLDSSRKEPEVPTWWKMQPQNLWWIPMHNWEAERVFYADGSRGQRIYVNPRLNTVIVQLADESAQDFPFRKIAHLPGGGVIHVSAGDREPTVCSHCGWRECGLNTLVAPRADRARRARSGVGNQRQRIAVGARPAAGGGEAARDGRRRARADQPEPVTANSRWRVAGAAAPSAGAGR